MGFTTECFNLTADSNKHFAEIGLFNLRIILGRLRRALTQNDKLQDASWGNVVDYLDSDKGRSELGFVFASLPSQPNGPVLYIGNGLTPFPYLVAESGWKTVVANRDVAAVQLLKQEGTSIFEAEVEHHVMDARSITLTPAQFEVVAAPRVLDSLYPADIPVALAEMFRAGRPGGRVLITLQLTPQMQSVIRDCLKLLRVDEALLETDGDPLTGLVIHIPESLEETEEITQHLRKLALEAAYPPSNANYQQINAPEYGTFWVNNDSVMTNALTYGDFDTKVFEQDVHTFLQKFLRPGDVFFDVGANVGVHTAHIAKLLNGQGSIHAFEPARTTFDCLVRNSLLPYGNNVYLNPIGLSVENGTLELYKAQDGYAALNSFGAPVGSGAASGYESELSWTTTLDDYVRNRDLKVITVLKIDVEGWEERVLRGAITTLLMHKPVVLIELTSDAAHNANSSLVTVMKLLQALGYDLYRYVTANNTLEALDADRETWRYTNALAIPHTRLATVNERLSGKDLPFTDTNTDIADLKVLLEENRSLRQRLTSGILDREITLLNQLLQNREADREARLAAIHHLQGTITELEGKSRDYEQLKDQLDTLRQKLDAQDKYLGQANERIRDYEITCAQMKDELEALYADYQARMGVIDSLSQKVEAQENHIQFIRQRKIVKLMRRLGRPLT